MATQAQKFTSSSFGALTLLAIINLLNYYDRMLVVVVSQPLRVEFALSDTAYGLLTGPAFVLVYASSSLLFGRLADRYERRVIISSALAIWSVMTAVCGFAQSFMLLAIGRAGVGVGEGGSNPAGMSLISDHFPAERRPMALAIFASGGMIGLFLSFVAGSWIATQYGWRAVFWIAAVPGLAIAVATLVFMREPPRGQFDTIKPEQLSFRAALKKLAGNSAYIWLCVGASLATFASLGMLIWLPQFFIRIHEMSLQQVGFLFGPAAALGLCAGMIAGGYIGNRFAKHSLAAPVLICIASNIVIIPLYLIVLWSASTTIALVACFLGMASAVIFAPAFQATMQSVSAPDVRGTAAASANVLIAIVGQGFVPFFVGVLSDFLAQSIGIESLRWSLTAATVFSFLAALAFMRAFVKTKSHFKVPRTKPGETL